MTEKNQAAVLDVYHVKIFFEGTREEVLKWLKENPENSLRVVAFYGYGEEVRYLSDCDFVSMHKELEAIRKSYPGYVGRFYMRNPETDDFVSTGSNLRNGMKVLIQSAALREDVSDLAKMPVHVRNKAEETNRWCTVTDVYTSNRNLNGVKKVYFIGVYEDGTKRLREYSADYMWYAKKDGMEQLPSDKREQVLKVVNELILNVTSNPSIEARWTSQISNTVTDTIIEILR